MHLPNSLNECSIRDVYARSWISGDALTGESANNRPLLGGVLKKPPTPMAHEVKRGTYAYRIRREIYQPDSLPLASLAMPKFSLSLSYYIASTKFNIRSVAQLHVE